jgi:hypothetical protein
MALFQREPFSPPAGTRQPGSDRSSANEMSGTPASNGSDTSLLSPRSRRQFGLFLAGATFTAFSALITRRALIRRYKATIPPYYHHNSQPRDVNGAADAAQALGLASLNVFSVAMMLTGGTLWGFNISSMDELRTKVRGGLGVDGTGKTEKEADEEIEEWLATVLSRKSEKEARAAAKKEQQVKTNDRGAPR